MSSSLKRELKVIDAAAFSIGLVGPVGAMALLGVGAVGILGRGATLAFVFALVVVTLVAYGFVKMSQIFLGLIQTLQCKETLKHTFLLGTLLLQ